MQSNPSQTTPKIKETDRSSPVTETDNSMAPTQDPSSSDARVPSAKPRKGTSTNTRLSPRMQSNPSQTTPKTKEADRSSPVTETNNSMARAPTQEPASPDAHVQQSTNAHKTSHQHTKSQGQSPRQGVRGKLDSHPISRYLSLPIKQDRGEEHITQEISMEIREADVQDDTSSQQMNRNMIRSTQSGRRENSGHPSRHEQTRDERGGANVREDVDGGANKGEGREGGREAKEAEGNELLANQSQRPSQPVRKHSQPRHRRESTRDAITHSERRDDPGYHSHYGQTHDERGGANAREGVDGRGVNEGEGGGGERDVKGAEGNELSANRSLRQSHHVNKPYDRREEARDGIFRLRRENDGTSSQQMNRNIRNTHSGRRDDSSHHNRQGQIHDERSDPNVREGVYDGGANGGEGGKGEREVAEAEDNELSTNQGLRPSHPVHRPDHGRQPTRDAMHSGRRDDPGRHARHGQIHDERVDANVREDVDDEGANEGEEGEREVKEAEDNEPLANQGLRPSHPMRRPYHRRESARDAIFRLEGTLRSRERDVNVLSTRNEQMRDEIKTLTDELARLQLEQNQTGQLLHERTVELSSAQFFLGKADTISVSDVSRMVDILNAEISQASNSITDSLFDHQATPATPDETELNRLLHKGQSSIGARLCKILARRLCQPSEEFDPMITQLALQAGLSKACYRIINDWNPPFWDSTSNVDRIYTNMRLTVGQVTAGRWRALARTYINGQDSEDGGQGAKERIQEANADYLRSTLRDLLSIVGWSPRDSHQDLPSEYSEKMRFLSDEALKLHETIGRGITSKDLIVDIIPCDTPFDPTKMDNADRQRRKPDTIPDDTVACTVELGLRYKSAKPGGESEETGVILKPKVLLASVLVGEETEETPPKPQD